jgi:hypothetical protein
MLSLLQDIIEIIGFIPEYILDAVETFINLIFSGIESVFIAATSIIPLPEVPSPPEYITAINWFFPIGAVISIATPIVAGYVAFLAIRWIFKWAGEL